MKVNGEKVEVLSYRPFDANRVARLALDHNQGTLVIVLNEGYSRDHDCLVCEPEELKFYRTDTRGNVETWHAIYKEQARVNPKTEARELFRPSFLCHVRRVDYDPEERRDYEKRERRREAARRAVEETARREQEAREQAELDRQFKLATVAMSKRAAAEPKPSKRLAVTRKEAASIIGLTERTIKNWEAGKGTPEGWPGRADPLALKAFAATRASQHRTKQALKNVERVGKADRLPAPAREQKEWYENMNRKQTGKYRAEDD